MGVQGGEKSILLLPKIFFKPFLNHVFVTLKRDSGSFLCGGETNHFTLG